MSITGPRPDGGLNTHVLMLLVSGSTKSREISLICTISYTIRGLFGQRVVTRREAGMILVMILKSDKPFLFLFCVFPFFCLVTPPSGRGLVIPVFFSVVFYPAVRTGSSNTPFFFFLPRRQDGV